MANCRYLYTFLFDSATITSSSEATNLVDDNVVQDHVGKKWRTTGDTSEWIKFDLGSALPIKQVAIFGHNLSSGATITLEANATDVWTAPSYSSAFTNNTRKLNKFLDQTYRWWRITFADASNPNGYIEMGRICAGVYIEPSANYRDGSTRRFVDPSGIDESEGQQLYFKERSVYGEMVLNYQDLINADRAIFETMFASIANHNPVVVAFDPTNNPIIWTYYSYLRTPLSVASFAVDYYPITELVFREAVEAP